ncbi:MAG: hypothetical protein J5517_03085 [Eubacterium sp.]|nr:hypothetical protein [Eubacterium sp.]
MNKTRSISFFSALVIIALFLFGNISKGSDVYAFSMNTYMSVTNDYSSRYYYNFLSDSQKEVYDELEEKLMDRAFYENTPYLNTFTLTVYDLSYQTVEDIAYAFQMDHYYLYWLYTYSYSIGTANVIKVEPNSRYKSFSQSDIQLQYKKICEKSVDVLKEVSKYATDEEKAYYIYTWITDNAVYAYDENGKPSEEPIDHSMYGNIVNQRSVCEGFAEAFTYFCTACGIPNAVVRGEADNGSGDGREGHAWNIIKLNGKYYYVDTTWDEFRTPENYKYAFVALDNELINSNHFPDHLFKVPSEEESSVSDYDLNSLRNTINNRKINTFSIHASSDCKYKIYNNGIEVPINSNNTNNIISVEKGSILTFVGTDLKCYSFYRTYNREGYEIEPQNYVVEGNEARFYIVSRKTRIVGYEARYISTSSESTNWSTEVNIISETGIKTKYINFDLILDDDTKNRAEAIKSGDYYIPSSFDENKLAGQRIYRLRYTKTDADADGFDTSADIPVYDVSCNYVKNCTLTLSKINGFEPKAYDETGKRLYSGTNVPYGTHIILKADSEFGEVTDEFLYSDSNVTNQLINGKGFVITENTNIRCNGYIINIVKAEYEKEVNVPNGTLPHAALLGLSTSAVVTTDNGYTKSFPITWDLSNYDYLDKTAHDVTVTGTIDITSNTYTLGDGMNLSTEAVLHVSGADSLNSLETEIPSELIVPAGTARNPYSLGLPIAAEFINQNGETVLSEIDWVPGEGSPYEMTGTVKRNGYTYDPIIVKVTEEGETITEIPDASVSFKINDSATNILDPTAKETIRAQITVGPKGNHKNRKITVRVPQGFSNVGVADASQLEGINKASITKNDDNTNDIVVEIDDSYKNGNLTFGIAMSSIFHSEDLDVGKLYPSFSDIPLIISYQADENGVTKSIDLDYSDHLKMGGGNEYIAEPSTKNYISVSVPYSKVSAQRDILKAAYKSSKNTSYLKYFKLVYPIEEHFYCDINRCVGGKTEFDEALNSMIYTRDEGKVYDTYYNYDRSSQYNIDYRLRAKEGGASLKLGVDYICDKNFYVIGEDYFGNEYIRTFNDRMSLYIYPYDENSNVSLAISPYSSVSDGTGMFNFDMKLSIKKSTGKVSLKPVNDLRVSFEIPEGTTVAGVTLPNKIKSIKFVYHDNTSKELDERYISRNYDYKETDENFLERPGGGGALNVESHWKENLYYFDDELTRKNSDGIKEMIINYEPISDEYESVMCLILAGTHTYTNHNRVDYGTYFKFKGTLLDYDTDCPVADMPVKVHTEYTDFSELGHTVHKLTPKVVNWSVWSSKDKQPFKSNHDLEFKAEDSYTVYEMSTDYSSTDSSEGFSTKDVILSSKLDVDPEVFVVKTLNIYPTNMEVGYDSKAVISIQCTDGNKYEYDLSGKTENGKIIISAPEGEGISEYHIYIDELIAYKDNKLLVQKIYEVDWDKWLEKGYQTKKTYEFMDAHAVSRDAEESVDSIDVSVTDQVGLNASFSYAKSLSREYDNKETGSVTAISDLVQKDGCTLTYWFSCYSNLRLSTGESDLGVTLPVIYDDLVVGVTTGNRELKVSDKDMPKLYDEEGNLLATASEIEYIYINNSSSYYDYIGYAPSGPINELLCKIHFKNIKLNNGDKVYTTYRIQPTSAIATGSYKTHCNVIGATPNLEENKALWAKEAPSTIHTKLGVSTLNIKMNSTYSRLYQEAEIDVLAAYTENAAMFGKTTASQDSTLTSYNVEAEETYDAILHLFTGVDRKMNNFEACISIPKEDRDYKIEGKEYDNTFDNIFCGIKAGSKVVNPHYYYKKLIRKEQEPEDDEESGLIGNAEQASPGDAEQASAGDAEPIQPVDSDTGLVGAPEPSGDTGAEELEESEYIEFSGNASDVEHPEDIISIKVTADSVANNDEITLSLKAPQTDKKKTDYVYSEITYDSETKGSTSSRIVSNVVTFVLGAGLEPVETPQPTESPKPEESPTPTKTPKVGDSPEPKETSASEESPKPEVTSVPKETPKPDETQEVKPTEKPAVQVEEPTESEVKESDLPKEKVKTKSKKTVSKKDANTKSANTKSADGNKKEATVTSKQTNGSVSTGDDTYIIPIFLIMVLSLSGIIFLIIRKKRG